MKFKSFSKACRIFFEKQVDINVMPIIIQSNIKPFFSFSFEFNTIWGWGIQNLDLMIKVHA